MKQALGLAGLLLALLALSPAAGAATFAEQRLSLATALAAPQATPRARVETWLRLAELEDRAGNPDLSVAALERALKLAGLASGIEALAPGLGGGADAGALLDKVVAAVVDNRAADPELFLQALGFRPDLAARQGAKLRAALLARPYAANDRLRKQLAPVFADQPAWRALLLNGRDDEDASLTSQMLATAGGEAGRTELLRRLSDRLQRRELPAARAVADQLVRSDRWQLRGQVLRLLLDDLPRVGAALTPADVDAAVDDAPGAATVVLALERARQKYPAANGVAVALAYRYSRSGMFVEARRQAAAVAGNARATAEQRAVAQAIEALAAIDCGDEASAHRWAAATDALASAVWAGEALERLLREGQNQTHPPRPPSPLARAALRTLFAAPFGPATINQSHWARRAALTFDDADLRTRGLAVLKATDPAAGRLVDDCVRRIVSTDECAARLRMQDRLLDGDGRDDGDSDDDATAAATPPQMLERLPDVPAAALDAWTNLPIEKLAALAPKLARLRTDRYLGTPGLVRLELAVQLGTHDEAAARATFARWQAVLPRGQRLALALLFATPAGKTAGPLAYPAALPLLTDQGLPTMKLRTDPGADDEDADRDARPSDQPLGAALLRRGDHPAATLERLLGEWKRVNGPDAADLAGWVWLLAREAGKPAQERAARARIDALAPGGAVAARVGVEIELGQGGNTVRARALAARLWLTHPTCDAAGDLFLTAWARAQPSATASADQQRWMEVLGDRFFNAGWTRLASAFRRGVIRGAADLAAHADALTDQTRLLDTWPDPDDATIGVTWWVTDRLGKLPAADLVPFARRVQAFAGRLNGDVAGRRLAFWSAYLAGDLPAARQALRPPETPATGRRGVTPLAADDDDDPRPFLLQLTDLPEPGLRQSLLRVFTHGKDDKTDLPARLAERADRASNPDDVAALRALGCLAATQANRVHQGLSLCAKAWAIPPRNKVLAGVLGELLARDPAAARQENVAGETFFNQVRDAGPKVASPRLAHLRARWLGQQGRSDEAAVAEAEAWTGGQRLGYLAGAVSPLDWGKSSPLMARVTAAGASSSPAMRHQTLGALAMVSADPEAARLYLRAVIEDRAGQPGSTKERQLLTGFLDIVDVAAADLARGRLDRAGLADVMLSLFKSGGADAPSTARRFPRALVATMIATDAAIGRGQTPSLTDTAALQREFPDNVTVIQLSVAALTMASRFPEAAALLSAAQKAHPGDQRLQGLPVPGAPTGPLPSWAATPRAFADALARADATPLVLAGVRSETASASAISAFVPRDYQADAGRPFAFVHDGVHLSGQRAPRVTHCLAAACLDEMAAFLTSQQLTAVWTRPVHLTIGDGHEGLFQGPTGLSIITAVPRGPHVTIISVDGPPDRLTAALPAVRLFRDTFQIADAALGPARTALLRWASAGHDDDGTEARARLQLARAATGTGCPIAPILAGVTDAQRRTHLLTNLILGRATADDRARLLACATPDAENGAALGLAALWDTSATAAAFGRAALVSHAHDVTALLRHGLDVSHQPVTGDSMNDREQLVAGIIQAAVALPPPNARTLIQGLLSAGDPRLRTLALAAQRWLPATLTVAEKAALLKDGADADTAVLAAALPAILDAPLLDAARARLDATGWETPAQRQINNELTTRVARALNADDGARLAATRSSLAARALAGDPGANDAVRAVDVHAAALFPGKRTTAATRALATRWSAPEAVPAGPPDPRAAELALRDLMPDRGWGYATVANPGALIAGLADSSAGGARGDGRGARSAGGALMVARILANLGADRLNDSGLASDRPFECAVSTSAQDSWVCAAWISDAPALRRRLEEGTGRDLGMGMPLFLGRLAAMTPMLNVFLPLMLPGASAPPRPAGGPSDSRAAPSGWLVGEQVRDAVFHGAVELRRITDVRVSGDHVTTTEQTLALVSPRRLWLFSDEQTAGDWLSRTARSGPEPDWMINPAVSGTGLFVAWPPGDTDNHSQAALALDTTSQGLRVRMRSPLSGPVFSGGSLDAYLPPGATAHFRAANMPGAPIWQFQPSDAAPPVSVGGPPVWLWKTAPTVAFAWYPAAEGAPRDRWLFAIPWDWAAERIWRLHRVRPPGSAPITDAETGLVYVRDDDVLVLASDMGLLNAGVTAAHRTPSATKKDAPALVASIAGRALADAIDRRARNAPPGTAAGDTLRTWASVSSLIASMDTTGTAADGVLASETWIRMATTPGSRGGSSIDEWLHSQRLKNSLRLPRPVGGQDSARPLSFVLRGASAGDILRAFPGSPRARVAPLDARRVRLTVTPAPPPARAQPLSDADQRLYLEADDGPASAPLRATARDVAGGQATPGQKVRAVVDWVHKEMTYEITPRSVDDVTLLSDRRGDCTEYAQLTVALLRALGVPARRHEGLMIAGNTMVAHAWAEFHDGLGWHEIDPTAGRTTVDAAYVDASVIDLLPLLTDGGIEITAVE